MFGGGSHGYSDPTIWAFDREYYALPRGIYGMLTVVDSKISTSSIRKFRIRMLTEKRSGGSWKASVINRIFVDFFDKSTGKEIATVELNRDGRSLFTNVTSGEDHALTESTKVHLTTGSSFDFKKIGKSMNIITDFGVEVTVLRKQYYSSFVHMYVFFRIPYAPYFDNVEGVCGQIDYENDRNDCTEN